MDSLDRPSSQIPLNIGTRGVYEVENLFSDPEMYEGSAREGMTTLAKRPGEKLMLALELVTEVMYVTEGFTELT